MNHIDLPGEPQLHEIKTIVAELEGLGHRGSGTSQEKLAGQYVQRQLELRGVSVEVESFRGQGSYGLRILLHLLLGLISLAILVWSPLFCASLTLLILVSLVLETSGFPIGFSNLLPPRLSQNVVGRIWASETAKQRIVLCAHLDSQRTGWIWSSNIQSAFARMSERLPPFLAAPLLPLGVVYLIQVVVAVVGTFGALNWLVSLSAVLLIFVYLCGIVVIGQWAFGSYVPGANDNASGVAAAVALTDRWLATGSEETELVVLFSGCEESGLIGAATWIKRHQAMIKEMPSVFVVLDLLGCNDLHFLETECGLCGPVFRYPEPLLKLCRSVANEFNFDFATPHAIPVQTDGLAFLARGISGITITSSEAGKFVPHYHQMSDRSENLNFTAISRATEFAWRVLLELQK